MKWKLWAGIGVLGAGVVCLGLKLFEIVFCKSHTC